MRNSPTDLELLEEIYRRYYGIFTDYSEPTSARNSKVYVPIDIDSLATHFKTDGDIIFGRLYYHLDPKFGVKDNGKIVAPFFRFSPGKDPAGKHKIQFPILAAAIATLRESRNQFLVATWLAAGSLVLSVFALCVGLTN